MTNFTLRDVLLETCPSQSTPLATEQHQSSEPTQPNSQVNEWICSGCTLRNDDSIETCVVCEMPRPEVRLRQGDRITLQGLNSSEYNDRTGVLAHFCYDIKRWQVKVDGKSEPIRIKPENIVLAPAQDLPGQAASTERPLGGVPSRSSCFPAGAFHRELSSPRAPEEPATAPFRQTASLHTSREAPFIVNERVIVTQALGLADGTEIAEGQAGRVVSTDVERGEAWIDFDTMLVFKWLSMGLLSKQSHQPARPAASQADASGGEQDGEETEQGIEEDSQAGEAVRSALFGLARDDLLFGLDRGKEIRRCPICLRIEGSDNCQCSSSNEDHDVQTHTEWHSRSDSVPRHTGPNDSGSGISRSGPHRDRQSVSRSDRSRYRRSVSRSDRSRSRVGNTRHGHKACDSTRGRRSGKENERRSRRSTLRFRSRSRRTRRDGGRARHESRDRRR